MSGQGLEKGAGGRQAQVVALRAALRGVIDPELGSSIVDLNMVRRVDVIGDLAQVDLVLTTPGCPLVGYIVEQVRQRCRMVSGIADATVRILDEPWEPGGWEDWLAEVLGDDDRPA